MRPASRTGQTQDAGPWVYEGEAALRSQQEYTSEMRKPLVHAAIALTGTWMTGCTIMARAPLTAVPPAPVHEIVTGDMVVTVMDPNHPDRCYQGVRFASVGAILDVRVRGHRFFNSPADLTRPLDGDMPGIAPEFDLLAPDGPPGFAEAAPGDGFLKIGVGVLERPDDQRYMFYRHYKLLQPAATELVREAPNRLSWTQQTAGVHGYAYRLEATVEADGQDLIMRYCLTNTGAKTLTTWPYHHNFLTLGADSTAQVVIRFPESWDWQPAYADTDPRAAYASLQAGTVTLAETVADPIQIHLIPPDTEPGPNRVRVEQPRTEQAVTIDVDTPPGDRTTLFATATVVCPEQFIQLVIPPGQQARWQHHYRFEAPVGNP